MLSSKYVAMVLNFDTNYSTNRRALKNSYWVKGRGFYANQKMVLKEIYNIKIFIILTLKVPQKLIFFLERPKFQIVIFFNTNHGRGSLDGTFTTNVSLVLLTKIYAHCNI